MELTEKLSPQELRQLQLIELDLLKEVDRVCRKHNIRYSIAFGTLLGAVRHKGYIPWDDDADIVMLREDYNRFREVAMAGGLDESIAFFQDSTTDDGYLWGYGKLRRVGTKYVRKGQSHLKGKTGVCIDIFPLDDVPRSLLGQMWQDFYSCIARKILWARVASVTGHGFWKYWYKLVAKIPKSLAYGLVRADVARSSNKTPNRVRVLMYKSFGKLRSETPLHARYSMPKEWFLERQEYKFEDTVLYGIADYDAFLSYVYGDYMTPPPPEQQVGVSPFDSYDFGGLHSSD